MTEFSAGKVIPAVWTPRLRIGYPPGIMQQNPDDEDGDAVLCPIALDRETRRRLNNLANAVGERPLALAAVLLSELLRDDDLFNAAAADPARSQRLN